MDVSNSIAWNVEEERNEYRSNTDQSAFLPNNLLTCRTTDLAVTEFFYEAPTTHCAYEGQGLTLIRR
jgi:hypothetical protein